MIKYILILTLIVGSCYSGYTQSKYIVIKNAQIIDGSGSKAVVQDVLIKNDKIHEIGKIKENKKYLQVDGRGKVLCPGFIDSHAHGDPLVNPEFKNFLAMGVTTILLGQDGDSPLYKDLNTWFDQIKIKGTAVNIASLGGHGSLRFLSGVKFKRVPSEVEIKAMKNILKAWLKAGCFGMSLGLEYVPGMYAQQNELIELAKTVGAGNGIIMSHMRNEDDDEIENSIHELLDQGKYAKVHIAHFKDVYGLSVTRADSLIRLIESHPNAKNLTADLYPYTASYTGIGIVFPSWALAPANYDSIKNNRRADLLDYVKTKINKRNGPRATLFGTGKFAGKTLEQAALENNKPFEEILVDDLGPEGASGAYFVMNEELQQRLLQWPRTMVSSDGSPTMSHPRGYGAFTRIIEEFVNNRHALKLEEAIYKMTGLPAATIGLKNRGLIKKGNIADLILFDPWRVRTRASYSQPFLLAEGIEIVFVNGKIVKFGSQFFENKEGKILIKK